MIGFFRKIRRKLADQNKFLQYSRYAIGEIVLVMVGILLALQVNNWNEQRKFNKLKKVYIERLIKDLKHDTMQITDLSDRLDKKQEIIRIAINKIDTNTTNEVLGLAIKEYFSEGWNMLDFTANKTTFSDLSQTGNMNVFGNTALIESIQQYYIIIENDNKGHNINKDWIIPLDVTLSQETAAFEFDPITAVLFKVEYQSNSLQDIIDHKKLFKRNAAGHFWFNSSLIQDLVETKNRAIYLINALEEELRAD
jgi:hypothetical protein